MAKTAQDYTDERYAGYRGEAEQLREQRRQSDDAAIQQYNEAADRTAAAAKKPYESQLEQLPGEYQKMLDYNALQELVGQRQVAESMANMGLTDSGLNRTQQTALAVQRGKADAQVRLAQQRKTEELQEKIAQITESNAAQKIQQEAAVRSESDSWYNNLLADFYNRASQEGTALYDADRTRAAQAAENERQRQAAERQLQATLLMENNTRPLVLQETDNTVQFRGALINESQSARWRQKADTYADYVRSMLAEWYNDNRLDDAEFAYLLDYYGL